MSSNGIKSLLPSIFVAGTLSLSCIARAEGTPSTPVGSAAAQTKAATQLENRETDKQSSAANEKQSVPAEKQSVATDKQNVATDKQNLATQNSAPGAKEATAATQDLGGTATSAKNTKGVPVKKVNAVTDQRNKDTAKAVNKVPGIQIQGQDLQPPAELPPITGLHPIKRLLQPVIRLGQGAVEIQQSMMKLEGPIAGLHPSMTSLDNKMTSVDHQMAHMQTQLHGMSDNVAEIDTNISKVGNKIDEVRQDISGIREQVVHVTIPIRDLQKPLHEMLEPLKDVTKPMSLVHGELAELSTMLRGVLVAIVVAVLAIVVGTPLAAVHVYRNRKKYFPHLREPGADLPIDTMGDKTLSLV
jgi:archaellum component FlaC